MKQRGSAIIIEAAGAWEQPESSTGAYNEQPHAHANGEAEGNDSGGASAAANPRKSRSKSLYE